MADYTCKIRTNYFRVKNPDAFRTFMGRIYGTEDSIGLWEEKNNDGQLIFGFGVCGGIGGLRNAKEDELEDDVDETAYDEFISGLQEHVAEDDAVIIFEVGSEKMRYVVGSATIITTRDVEYLDITQLAVTRAATMLGNTNWETKCEY